MDELDLIKSELAETIGKDQLVEKLARIRTKSETRDRRMSETSGKISPNKSGSGVNLNSSQENLRKRTSEAKDEGPKSPQKPKANEKQVRRCSVALTECGSISCRWHYWSPGFLNVWLFFFFVHC